MRFTFPDPVLACEFTGGYYRVPQMKRHTLPRRYVLATLAEFPKWEMRNIPELAAELDPVMNAFDPWARDRGQYCSLQWKPRAGAESDESFPAPAAGSASRSSGATRPSEPER